MIRNMLLLTAALTLCTGTASAQIFQSFEFDVDGILPSADPAVTFVAGSAIVETAAVGVSGGTMTSLIQADTSHQVFYSWPDVAYAGGVPAGGGIDGAVPWIFEARVRVLDPGSLGGGLMIWTGNHRYSLLHTATGVRATRARAVSYVDYAFDNSQWHVIRLEGIGGGGFGGYKFNAYVDGVKFAANEPGITNAGNGLHIRLAPHSGFANLEWDWVRFESGENAVPVDESSWGGIKAAFGDKK